ncbi:hypothetical protein RRG08_017877 [Elysia crispata]|uniref:SMCHD1 Ig-like domain-containing protein n=1 Tax=Elysia crispata TaxID=231223 RepID=A0AAE1CJU0_9GAST|nr:hypothetical protein RRG08_017877 [Elysia crispata]
MSRPETVWGTYEIRPKAQLGRSTLCGPAVKVIIQANPLKPVAVEVSCGQTGMPVMAGHTTLDFSVVIKSETGAILKSARSDCLSMQFSSVQAHAVVKTGPGSYIFKKCQVPDKAGNYFVEFLYDDGSFKVKSYPMTILVGPGHPAVIAVSDGQLTTPTVSNTRSATSRMLIKSLNLELRDEFDNVLDEGYNGKVKIQITSDSNVDEVPCLNNEANVAEFSLINGRCRLQNLLVRENTSGKDGFEYHLKCTVICDAIPKNKPLLPLNIPFLFYNGKYIMDFSLD